MMSLHHGGGFHTIQLLPTSILDTYKYKVFEHIDMLSIGIR
jgi:hypothetical protein